MKLTVKELTINVSDESVKTAKDKAEFVDTFVKANSGLGVPDEELETAFAKAYDLVYPPAKSKKEN